MKEAVTRQDLNDPKAITENLFKVLSEANPQSNPFLVTAAYLSSLLEQRAPLTAVSIVEDNASPPVWLVVTTSIFLILFVVQVIVAMACLVNLNRLEKFWVIKRSKSGIFVVNTQTLCLMMASLFSICLSFDLIAFLLAIYDVSGADSRVLILSIEWLPCFLAGWFFLWGLGGGIYEVAYSMGSKLASKSFTKFLFNFTFLLLPSSMTISQVILFSSAQYQMLQAIGLSDSIQESLKKDGLKYNPQTFNATTDVLPQVLNLRRIIPNEKELAKFLLWGRAMWIFWALLISTVYLFLSITNRLTSGMSQYDAGAEMAVMILVIGKALLAIIGLVITTKFYRKLLRKSSFKNSTTKGSGTMFGVGMNFHKEIMLVIEGEAVKEIFQKPHNQ
ncbi:hypothetical protein PPACK8108_LOCUS6076 [Phakopsora pachyrhizi]|uniref:Uncharacterized protein n=1 Tax=Phakopsora pachyrhizi TaxID=170000 RepID=A0AAV0AQ43_PHAPC|nr:hypothetical protein PPACK8108_LOCUS6076 [Phakopsora pachyrhizi]